MQADRGEQLWKGRGGSRIKQRKRPNCHQVWQPHKTPGIIWSYSDLQNCSALGQDKWASTSLPPSVTGHELSLEGHTFRWGSNAVETVIQQVKTSCCSPWVTSHFLKRTGWHTLLSIYFPLTEVNLCVQGTASSGIEWASLWCGEWRAQGWRKRRLAIEIAVWSKIDADFPLPPPCRLEFPNSQLSPLLGLFGDTTQTLILEGPGPQVSVLFAGWSCCNCSFTIKKRTTETYY